MGRIAKTSEQNLEQQAQEIMHMAEARGVQSNFFFATTFERYLTQIGILKELKKSLDEDGMLVTKEYVKDRKNVYTHPAVGDYNRTTDSANKTVATLMKILNGFGSESKGGSAEEEDPLMKLINGGD